MWESAAPPDVRAVNADAGSTLRRLYGAYERRRFATLFFSLLVTLAVVPLVDAIGGEGWLIEGFLGFNLLLAAQGLARRGSVALVLAAVATIALRLVARLGDADLLLSISDVVWVLLGTISAAGTLRFALTGKRVTSEHVYAALSVYLLLGHFFGMLDWTVEQIWPASYAQGGVAPVPGGFGLPDAIYFSFVTLATLGYGDVTPVGGAARGLAVFEAIAGQLYVAVLLARLVGSHLAHSTSDGEPA